MNSVDRDSIHLTHHFIVFSLFRDKRELGLQVIMAGECSGHTGPVQVWTIIVNKCILCIYHVYEYLFNLISHEQNYLH